MPFILTADGGATATSFFEGSGGGFRNQGFTLTRTGADLVGAMNIVVNTVPAPAGAPASISFGNAPPAGTDVGNANGGFAVAAGAPTLSFNLLIEADSLIEPDERFNIILLNVISFSTVAETTFTILDDDTARATLDAGARADAFRVLDAGTVSGNVYYDNGHGADVGGSMRMQVAALEGFAAAIGVPVILSSGASVVLRADGTFTYSAGNAFAYLPLGATATDGFTYTLNNGDSARVTFTVVGIDNSDVLSGAGPLAGGIGDDIYTVDSSATVIVEAAGAGTDTVLTGGDYTLGAGVSVEVLAAQTRSGTGALVLRGNAFAQTIAGNDGANTIDGGAGADMLIGGSGADHFRFSTALGDGNIDTIVDFAVGVDRIALASDVFAGLGASVGATALATGTAATTADQRLIYDSGTGQLFYDADGSGTGAAVLFAQLTPGLALSPASFEIIPPVAAVG